MRRLDVYTRDIYVGDLLCLAVHAAGGRIFEITEETGGLSAVGDAIERYLPGSMPHAEWTLRVLAADPGESVTIYRTNGAG